MNDDLVKRLQKWGKKDPFSEADILMLDAADRIEQLERELAREKASRAKLRIDGISIYNTVYGQRSNPETNEVAVGYGEKRGPFFIVNEQGEVIAMDLNGAALMDNSSCQAVLSELAAEKALADRLRGEVCGLWMLLDDIDTLDDACKDNDAVFRKRCYDKQRSRFNIVSGEAYDDYRKARGLA